MALVALGSDHAGFHLRHTISQHLVANGHQVLDLGCETPERCDYPDFGAAVGRAVVDGDAECGICVCGSGIGIAMAANKIPGVRAGTVHDMTSARLAREHNDANVICLGERFLGEQVALDAVDAYLGARFEGGRHTGRVAKIDSLLL